MFDQRQRVHRKLFFKNLRKIQIKLENLVRERTLTDVCKQTQKFSMKKVGILSEI